MPNCDACYGEKTDDCPDDCLTVHVRYLLTKLKKGKTFSKPQEKLNRIYEIFEKDMVCAFCDGSWFYNEIAKVIGYDLEDSEFKENEENENKIHAII